MINTRDDLETKALNSISCFLIGSSSLMIQCGDILMSAGFNILGVMSEDPQVVSWAQQKGLVWTDDFEIFKVTLNENSFDYLFSIFNKRYILSSVILHKPKQFTINCHDAPLPKYAGANATAWAILNGEQSHGITWHIVTEKLDAGDIVKQTIFPIDQDETALTLNLKCYEHARLSFIELLGEISNNTIKRVKQDLQKRSFFNSYNKPRGNALIRWSSSAEEIARVHRALNFGEYCNPMVLPKFTFGEEVIIPESLSILEQESTQPPGTIVAINTNSIEVATSTRNIILKQFINPLGQAIDVQLLSSLWKVYTGSILPSPSSASIKAIDEVSLKIARYELFWVRKFSCITEPTEQPFIIQNSKKQLYSSSVIAFSFRPKIKYLADNAYSEGTALTLLLMYLYRINNHQNLLLYFSNRIFKSFSNECKDIFSDYVPLSTCFTHETNFEDALKQTLKELKNLEEHQTFAKDIFSRYSVLKNCHTLHWAIDIVDDLDNYQGNGRFPITIAINHSGDKFRVFSNSTLVYDNPDVLANTIASHLRCLANSIIEDNRKSIAHLNFIPNNELNKMLAEWNHTNAEFPSDKTIVQIFEEQVLKFPHHIAVDSEERSLTYAELNEKANQLAHYLLRICTRSETLVGIYLERNVDFIVCIMATLKAGAAYVPLDPSHAKEYIKNMLTDVAVVITHPQHRLAIEDCLAGSNQSHIVELGRDPFLIEGESDSNPLSLIYPQNLAYVLYTSGSTGKPKGALIKHQSVVNLAHAQARICKITAESCVLAFASFSFDASVFEIFSSLLSGARLYIAKKEAIMPGEPLNNTVQQNNVTVAVLPPIILEMTPSPALMNLKTIVLGGEVFSEKINLRWNREGLLLINGYGATETTVCSTVKVCLDKNVKPTIGRPIDNTTVYVLDQYLQPVPIGTCGELYIGGAGIAQGYLNQPELTEQKFISNPFRSDPKDSNHTLYKSGDIGRWLPNGELEYRGRIDEQIKIRGHRVELSAIEAILQTCPLVQQSVVTALRDDNEHRYLVAYIVPISEQNFDLNIVRKYLTERIPSYMIPQSFVTLDCLPMNVNGKVDKKALPLPKKRLLLTDAEYVLPKTEAEIELAKVWSRILNVENIGIHDNFFNLGGHSLLVTEALLHIKQSFNFNVSFKRFFDEPTISQLAMLIDHRDEQDDNKVNDVNTFAFYKDAILPANMQFSSVSTHKKKIQGSIFLTGATGFLGVHLLHNLHSLSTAKIYCLIRGKNDDEIRFRMNKEIVKYHLKDLLNSDRIVFLLGDLNQKHFGLTAEIFDKLANEVDAIYHNGAAVNHIYDFESLKKTNVDSTLEVIRLAATGKQKKIHYISALNAVVDVSRQPIIKENFATEHTVPLNLHNGYCQTKWVSEQLLFQAKERGLHVNIYRPNWISGQLSTGIWEAKNNHLLNFIKSCIQIGYAPNENFSLEMWPVDCLSHVIVQIALNGPQHNGVYNFTNPNTLTWHDLVKWLNKNGHSLSSVSVPVWRRHCFDNMTKENALYPFAALYLQDTDGLSGVSQEKVPKIESRHTAAVLKSLGINYPNIDTNVLKVYFDYLYKINFIQPPPLKLFASCVSA